MKKSKTKSVLLITLLLLLSIGFYSCKDDEDDTEEIVPGTSEQDEDFAISASYVNIAEIRLSQMAVQKSTNDSINSYAREMITDHTTAQNELRTISNDLNIVLNDSLDQAHSTLYNQLSALKGFAFDSAYIANQVTDHQSTKTLLETMISNRGDSSLVSYANKRLPIVNRHLQKAIDTRTRLNENRGK